MSDPPPESRPPVGATPAATVVVMRDAAPGLEVLLLRRNSRGVFGGMWVFPGGKVDPVDLLAGGPDDRPGIDDLGWSAGEHMAAARRAAVREAGEEAGLDLEADDLAALSFWVPPPEVARRFATWFFLARAPSNAEVVVDQTEIYDHRWVSPAEAMAQRDDGLLDLAPPTFMTLWWLSGHIDSASALAAVTERPPLRFETHMVSSGGVAATVWSGDVAYEDGDLERPGPRRRLVMDPAGWRVETDGS